MSRRSSPRDALTALLTAVVLGASFFCLAAQQAPSPPRGKTPNKSDVESAYNAYLRAWKDKDYSALNRMLSDDYRAVNYKGIVSTKENEIATAREDRTYEALTGDVMSVSVFGESAIASGLIQASWKDDHGSAQQATFRFLAMLQKQQGGWKLVATQSTRFKEGQ